MVEAILKRQKENSPLRRIRKVNTASMAYVGVTAKLGAKGIEQIIEIN
jgi:malate/lactate dehydrogenase